MNDDAAPFPFIVGVGRSGTTLLRSMLDAHSKLAVVHESRFIAWMARHRTRYETDDGFDSARFVADLFDPGAPVPSRVHSWALPRDVVRAAVMNGRPDDLAAAIRLVFRAYADANGKPRYGDKTPGYVRFLSAVGELLPEARFVHLVRDGRDVALSMMDLDFGSTNVAHAAWLWARGVGAAHAVGRLLGASRYLVVRYDHLIDATESELKQICEFVDLPFEAGMLEYHEHPERVAQGLGAQGHHVNVRRPVTQGLRDWRTQMPPGDVAVFETVAGPVLAEFGYQLASPPAPHSRARHLAAEVRITEGRARAVWQTRRRRRQRR
ncbi:MAG: sulfotransferase family protein [Acidimicrobiales bacterium]